MQNIRELFNRKPQKKPPTYQWQELALEVLEKIPNAYTKKASVFKACKKDPHLARLALLDSIELDKRYVLYWLKVFNELCKKPLLKP